MATTGKPNRFLVVVDFDRTVTAENTDSWILECLLPVAKVKELNSHRRSQSCKWQEHMKSGFQALRGHKISREQLLDVMRTIPLVRGFKLFLQLLGSEEECSVIIASDSNSVFIDTILEEHDLKKHVDGVFTNPAHFDDDDHLRLFPHHSHSCPTCQPNLCKQEALRLHLEQEEKRGHEYERIFMMGDGDNDFCPCKLLKETDCIFARRGYRLMRKIEAAKSDNAETLAAPVVPWDDGADLLTSFRTVTGLELK